MAMSSPLLPLALLAAALIAGGCTASAQTAEKGPTVTIAQFKFDNAAISVPKGTTVTWMNNDDIEHSVTAGTSDKPSGTWDSGLFAKGKSFTFSFTTPGEYTYFCSRHTFMAGTVKVTG